MGRLSQNCEELHDVVLVGEVERSFPVRSEVLRDGSREQRPIRYGFCALVLLVRFTLCFGGFGSGVFARSTFSASSASGLSVPQRIRYCFGESPVTVLKYLEK